MSFISKNRILCLLILGMIIVVLSACGSQPASQEKGQPLQPAKTPAAEKKEPAKDNGNSGKLTAVSVGLLYINADAGIFVAQEKGYFKEQGLDVKLQKFTSGADMVALLATNKLDVGSGSVNPGLYNSFRQGMGIKMVSSKSTVVQPNFGGASLLVRQDLWDSKKVKDAGDLKGMKIAVNNIGTTSSTYTIRGLEAKGLTKDDVKWVDLPLNQIAAAFTNKAIDAAWMFDPLMGNVVKQGIATELPGTNTVNVANGEPTNLMFYSPDFAKTDEAKKFMIAQLKGLRDYYKAIVKGEGNKDEIYQILSKYSGIAPEAYKSFGMSGVDPDGDINVAALKKYQDEWIKWGFQKELANLDKNIDTTFVEYALKELGKYKR